LYTGFIGLAHGQLEKLFGAENNKPYMTVLHLDSYGCGSPHNRLFLQQKQALICLRLNSYALIIYAFLQSMVEADSTGDYAIA
jgi:hypothetical protein